MTVNSGQSPNSGPVNVSSIYSNPNSIGHVSVVTSAGMSTNPFIVTSESSQVTLINSVNVPDLTTVTSRRNGNTSVTLLNANSGAASQRMSVFEPYPMRDTVQHFCEKHLDKIKAYMDKVSIRIPPPAKCTIEGNVILKKSTFFKSLT